jgi:hypothetical protein
MDKLSEYIPLLIIIVSVIISLAGKKKRKITLPEEVFPEMPSYPLVPDKPIIKKEVVTPIVPKAPVLEKKQHPIHKKIVEIRDNDEYEGTSIDFSEPDEMKKAIIYSEIFNKKDF